MSGSRRSGEHRRPSGEHQPPALRIVLADDHPLLRAGVKALLDEQRDMTVVGEAADGLDACRLVERLKPDVLVIDFSMPRLDGASVTRSVMKSHPALRVIALTVHEDDAHIARFLDAGAVGYVLKRTAADDLIDAVRTVAKGETHIDPAVAKRVVGAYFGHAAGQGNGPKLSAREIEVLQLGVRGLPNKAIAAQLNVSVRTVETYRARLMAKLGFHSREQLVDYALACGLL